MDTLKKINEEVEESRDGKKEVIQNHYYLCEKCGRKFLKKINHKCTNGF